MRISALAMLASAALCRAEVVPHALKANIATKNLPAWQAAARDLACYDVSPPP